MIARTHRFHGYGSLRGVYRRGQTVRGPQLSLKFADRGPQRPYRVAVVVSRKVSKSAVVRNRIRRRIYEIAQRQAANLPGGFDLVFTAYHEELAALDPSKLERTVGALLKKVVRPATSAGPPHDIVNAKEE